MEATSTFTSPTLGSDVNVVALLRDLRRAQASAAAMERLVMSTCVEDALAAGNADAISDFATLLSIEFRQSDLTTERALSDAWSTVTRSLPLHTALAESRISVAHGRVIERLMAAVPEVPERADNDDEVAADRQRRATLLDQLIALAEVVTPGVLGRRGRRLVDAVLAEPLEARHRAAVEERSVWLQPADDGMCTIVASLPALLGVAIMDRLTKGAKRKPIEDPRTYDQFRADAFAAILLAGEVPDGVDACQRITPVVTVTIPATELARESGETTTPASLDGRMLVDTATVGSLAVDTATWQRLFTHPVTGLPVAVDRYRPTELQRQFIRLRDGSCRWPGCTKAASGCDIDHSQDYARGGATRLDNLACLCRHHHVMKHARGATITQLAGGVLEFSLPGGVTVRTSPESPPGCAPPPLARRTVPVPWSWVSTADPPGVVAAPAPF